MYNSGLFFLVFFGIFMTLGNLYQQIDYQRIHLSDPYYLKALESIKPEKPSFYEKINRDAVINRFNNGDKNPKNIHEASFICMDKLIRSSKTMARNDMLSAARQLTTAYPKDDQVYFILASLFIQAGHYSDAMTYLQLCTYYNENHIDAWAIQGLLASLAKDYGKAVQASRHALLEGKHLHKTLHKAFVFSLFLIGSPAEFGNMSSTPLFKLDSGSNDNLVKDVPVEFYKLSKDLETFADKPVILCSSDSGYFSKYTKNLVLSLKGTEDIQTIHIHLINPTEEDLIWIDQNCCADTIVSTEKSPEAYTNTPDTPAYMASIRFIRTAYFIHKFKADYLIVDVDSILNSKRHLKHFYENADKVALYYVNNSPIWDKISAPFVYIPHTEAGIAFINRCASYLDVTFHNTSKSRGFWYIDQLALMGSYLQAQNDVNLIEANLLSDINCGQNSIFWTLSNHRPKPEYREKCSKLTKAQQSSTEEAAAPLASQIKLSDQALLSKFMKAVIMCPQNAKAIQIGANDGISYDPIYASLKKRPDIHITLVEPIVEYFRKLVENYSYRENVNFLNIAVSDQNGEAELRYVPLSAIERDNLPSWARGLATLETNKNGMDSTYESSEGIQKTDEQNVAEISKATEKQTARLVNINELLDHPFYKDLHLLVTDCEGHDYTLLKALDLNKSAPDLILSEWNLMNRDKQEEIVNKFSSRYSLHLGYEYFFAVKKEANAQP